MSQSGITLSLPGTLRREIIGYSISEPDPDVDPDPIAIPFLMRTAKRLSPKWTRSVRRFGETNVWGRGEFGGEDIRDGEVWIGTKDQHIHLRHHYSEHEQEMFPTGRHETRWYVLHGIPPRRRGHLRLHRDWRAGRLECAELTIGLVAPKALCEVILADFKATFEKH